MFGASSDRDLLAALIGEEVPTDASVPRLLEDDFQGLTARGLSPAACRRLLACAELARRFQPCVSLDAPITTASQALTHFEPLRAATVEILAVLLLDVRLRLIRTEVLATGGMAAVAVSPRELFASAMRASAGALVIGHNHPSGDCSPSPEDISFTRSIVAVGELLRVEVLDHLIVSRRAFTSLRQHHSGGTPAAPDDGGRRPGGYREAPQGWVSAV